MSYKPRELEWIIDEDRIFGRISGKCNLFEIVDYSDKKIDRFHGKWKLVWLIHLSGIGLPNFDKQINWFETLDELKLYCKNVLLPIYRELFFEEIKT